MQTNETRLFDLWAQCPECKLSMVLETEIEEDDARYQQIRQAVGNSTYAQDRRHHSNTCRSCGETSFAPLWDYVWVAME